MTNPSLFNGDVRHDVSGGPVRNTPQVTKSEPACNPSLSPSWVEGNRSAAGPKSTILWCVRDNVRVT